MNTYGFGYQPVESYQLQDGIYEAKITKVEKNVTDQNKKYITVFFNVGGNEKSTPNRWMNFDRPTEGFSRFTAEEAQKMWDATLTKFFDSFSIPRGNFDFESWVGKKGQVTVRQQKNDSKYKEIVPYALKKSVETKKEPVSDKKPEEKSDFTEDIPF